MEILWLAIVFYSAGLAVVLHVRPLFMFHENGSWKEFGYKRDSRHTIFPFWLFAVTWAFVSYTLAATLTWTLFSSATAAATLSSFRPARNRTATPYIGVKEDKIEHYFENEEEDAENTEDEEEAEDAEEIHDVEITPVSNVLEFSSHQNIPTKTKKNPRPGYYVLENATKNKNSGLRKYIYYGPSPPDE
jgi:hypothetical protein